MKKLNLPPTEIYPHVEGLIRLAYTSDGEYIITVAGDGYAKRYKIGSPDEPLTVDQNGAKITSVATTKELFVTCNDECSATVYSVKDMTPVNTVLRSSLPLRNVAFSPDQKWIAACGDDSTVKLVEASDILNSFQLPDHPEGVLSLSFHPDGRFIGTTCKDGSVRIYSLSSQSPDMTSIVPDMLPKLDSESAFTGIAWHPNGNMFAVQTKSKDIAIISGDEWEKTDLKFKDHHTGFITDVKWSPNGKYLASSDANRLIIWDSSDGTAIAQCTSPDPITSIAWDPSKDAITFATEGHVMYTLESPVDDTILSSTLSGIGSRAEGMVNGNGSTERKQGSASVASYNGDNEALNDDNDEDMLGKEVDDLLDDFVEDDDNAGYAEKRTSSSRQDGHHPANKRFKSAQMSLDSIEVLHSGATPWRNGRRYLCMNSVGYIWSVSQDTHNTITVTFHDKGMHREYHFTDYNKSYMASLSEDACICASEKYASLQFHRGNRQDNWEYEVAEGDSIRAVSISDRVVVICTTRGFVRAFNIYGTPLSVYRHSRDPLVAVSTYKGYIMLVRSNSIGQYTCTIESQSQVYVKDEPLDIAPGQVLDAVFFSDKGDPCIYDDGVLLALANWKEPLQSRWVPLLDTRDLSNNSNNNYWPVGVVDDEFQAIITRGSDKYPMIPLPVFEQFELRVPKDQSTQPEEQEYLTKKALYDLHPENDQLSVELDRFLLKQLNVWCQKTTKSMGIVQLLRNSNALDIAKKIAIHHDNIRLAERIEEYKDA